MIHEIQSRQNETGVHGNFHQVYTVITVGGREREITKQREIEKKTKEKNERTKERRITGRKINGEGVMRW